MSVNTTYKRILVPSDGSKGMESPIAHALELATQYNAQVDVLYIVDTDAVAYGLGVAHLDRLKDGRFEGMGEVAERAQTAVDALVEQAEERGIETVAVIGAGNPVRMIANYAEDHPIDLIVMGSHRRSGVRRMLQGSVANRVARLVKVPVLTVDVRAGHESRPAVDNVTNHDGPALESTR